MAVGTITVLDPTATSKRKGIQMAVRLDRLEGKVLGLIWNSKPGGDVLLKRFAEPLNKRFHFSDILWHKKQSASLGLDEDSLNEFSMKCDLVIVAMAD